LNSGKSTIDSTGGGILRKSVCSKGKNPYHDKEGDTLIQGKRGDISTKNDGVKSRARPEGRPLLNWEMNRPLYLKGYDLIAQNKKTTCHPIRAGSKVRALKR